MTINTLWNNQINRNYLYALLKNFSFSAAVLVPFFTNWGHISLLQVQLIQSWFSLWVFILEIPTGAVADRLGRKYSIALGSFAVAIAVIIYGSFPHFGVFLLAEFLFAVGYALTSGADQALLYDTLKSEGREDESKKILGRADSFHLAGMMLAAPIGSYIATQFGINAPMLMSSIPLLLASIVGLSIKEPKVHSEGSQSPRYLDIVRRGFGTIRHNTVVRTLAIDSVLVAASAYFVIWFYQPLLTSLNIPIIYFGLAQSLLVGFEILISSNFVFLERFLGVGKKYIRYSALLVSLSFFAVAIFPNLFTVIMLIIVGGALGLTRATYIVSIANKYIRSRERATLLSSIGMIRRFSLVLLNPIIGATADRSLPIALVILGLFPLGTFLIKEEIE